jgi:hypothetical protein
VCKQFFFFLLIYLLTILKLPPEAPGDRLSVGVAGDVDGVALGSGRRRAGVGSRQWPLWAVGILGKRRRKKKERRRKEELKIGES